MVRLRRMLICVIAVLPLFACSTFPHSLHDVPVPALDEAAVEIRYTFGNLLSLSELEQRLSGFSGERVDRPGEPNLPAVTLHYAVRHTNSQRLVIPAALLRITFDADGIVTDWHFVHPLTGEQLEVEETRAHAEDYLDGGWCVDRDLIIRPVKKTRLDTAIRIGYTSKEEVQQLLDPYGVFFGSRANVSEMAGGQQWDYPVDRPSPFFIPPVILTVESKDGELIDNLYYFNGYGCCPCPRGWL